MSQQWRVLAWAGAYSWDERDDAAAPTLPLAGSGRLASPMTWAQSDPSADVAPLVQPNPDTATFQVIVASTASIDQLQLGDPVTLRYFASRTPAATDKPLVEFTGRVATLDASPSDLGMLYTIGCADYTVDLGEQQVGFTAYPSETLDNRVRRILGEAGVNVPAGVALYGGTATLPIASTIDPRAIGSTDALELLTHTLAQYRMEFTGFPNSVGIAYLYPVLNPPRGSSMFSSGASVLDTTNGPYQVGTRFRTPPYTAPLRVTLVGATYTLTGSPTTTAPGGVAVVDAGRVDMATSFGQRKGDGVNSVQVTSDSWGRFVVSWSGVAQVVTAAIDTELSTLTDGSSLGVTYFPSVKPSGAALWVADALTWLIDAEPGAWALPPVGRGFMVTRVKGVWSPIEREWYVGLISGWTFKVDGGVPSAQLVTAPWNVDPSKATNPVKWSDLVVAMTWANMSTRDTYTDYGLAGI